MIAAILVCGAAITAAAQAAPPVKVNVINVCTPSADEQKDLATVLAKVPARPRFAVEFEVARGRSVAPDAPISNWVRVRRDLPPDLPFTTVQYAITVDEKGIVETLVFHAREGSDLVQVSVESKVTSGTPAAVLGAETPASRMRVERIGKPARALARCTDADQSGYESLFARGSEVLNLYRRALNVRTVAGEELAKLGVHDALPPRAAPKTRGKKTAR